MSTYIDAEPTTLQEPADLRKNYDMIRRTVEACRDDGALDPIMTPGVRRLLGRLDRLGVDLVPIRLVDWQRRLVRRLGGTVIVGGEKPLIWIDVAAHRSDAALADTLFHEAIHASGRDYRNHTFLPDETLHQREYAAEEIVARLGANLIAGFVGFDLHLLASHNDREVAIYSKRLRRFGWNEERLHSLSEKAHDAASYLANANYDHLFETRLRRNIWKGREFKLREFLTKIIGK